MGDLFGNNRLDGGPGNRDDHKERQETGKGSKVPRLETSIHKYLKQEVPQPANDPGEEHYVGLFYQTSAGFHF